MTTGPVAVRRMPNSTVPNTSVCSRPTPTTMPLTASGAVSSASAPRLPRPPPVATTATTTPIGTASSRVPVPNSREFTTAGSGRVVPAAVEACWLARKAQYAVVNDPSGAVTLSRTMLASGPRNTMATTTA
jgi:hypothetical protein